MNKKRLMHTPLQDLPNDVLKYCFSFIPGSYVTVGPVSKHFYSNYSTLGIHESASFNAADTLLQIGRNKRTTVGAVSSDLQLTEYCFIVGAPDKFMEKVCTEAAIKSRRDILDCSETFGINCKNIIERNSRGYSNRRIMDKLAEEGNLDMIKYLVRKYHLIRENSFSRIDDVFEGEDEGVIEGRLVFSGIDSVFNGAAKKGHLDILQWINENFPNYLNRTQTEHESMLEENGSYMFDTVFSEGNLATIKWFVDNIDLNIDSEEIYRMVAWRGELRIFEAMRGYYEPAIFNEEIFEVAALRGNVELLDYLYQNNCPFYSSENMYSKVLDQHDNDKALLAVKWLCCHNFPWDEETCASAASNKNLSALKWVRNEGCPWDERTLVEASWGYCGSKSDITEMIQYCIQHGCPLSSRACQYAMHNSDDSAALEVLKLLRTYSCPWDEKTCEDAADRQNFESLIWAKSNGCPWNPNTFLKVLSSRSITVIEYFLRSENELLSLDGIFERVFSSGGELGPHLGDKISDDSIIAKLKVLRSYGLPLTARACFLAAHLGRLRALQWLKYMECPWDVATCTGAVCGFQPEILKYAHENGCEWNENTYGWCFKYATEDEPLSSSVKMLQYLEENNCPKPSEIDRLFREMKAGSQPLSKE
ncbi:hypothetical protein CTEN210_01394 [Chaetoceros tenuissimus]|uniref:Uncharacterized protein n=1 Tax=Chaetoceros tenuissimus TaxID=426638 RepID=A0AAD3CGX2_9STRA|nr:hypothetical protein CTEN210_01394 [Chaetoceros tenuissimus]